MKADKIENPYIFSKSEQKTIKYYFKSYKDWDNDAFLILKKNIVEHLRYEQNNKCCYCKKELGFDIKEVEIEHIAPKSKYEKFTFYNKNLALSCPSCNTKKSTKDVLTKKIVQYPRGGSSFCIIHAHYDDYNEHIIIKNGCVFTPLSFKGTDTIKYCELFRLSEVASRAKKFQVNKSPIATLTESIRNAKKEEIDDLVTTLKEVLNQ